MPDALTPSGSLRSSARNRAPASATRAAAPDVRRPHMTGPAGIPICCEDRAEWRLPEQVSALALENGRLQAALAAQREEVRASRARIVQAGLDERRKVERDLHDSAQQRLPALSLTIAMIGDRLAAAACPDPHLGRLVDAARDEIRAAIGELGRGIHPAVLANQGLAAAAETLAARAPLPVTTAIDRACLPWRG